eukprot:TRINITY_DN49237_c0_g1_i1.p1 TRINITY_DN49237_c0_g1~~TRINITY_DN49237_c0_g1_i1.p1  ORF type:complete len:212 (-),score=50.47 TRINITY_DN49237_c0_g1_i1:40-675(-)
MFSTLISWLGFAKPHRIQQEDAATVAAWANSLPLTRQLPDSVSRQLPSFVPVWKHRSVSKAWHRIIVETSLRERLRRSENPWKAVQLSRVSSGYFEGGMDFVARRLELDPPDERIALTSDSEDAQLLLSGKASVHVLRGSSSGPVEEVAHAEGHYRCQIEAGEKAVVKVVAVRTSAVSANNNSSDENSVETSRNGEERFELSAGQTLRAKL